MLQKEKIYVFRRAALTRLPRLSPEQKKKLFEIGDLSLKWQNDVLIQAVYVIIITACMQETKGIERKLTPR